MGTLENSEDPDEMSQNVKTNLSSMKYNYFLELLNMKISSDKQHMYTLNMHISIPNIVLLKLPCLQFYRLLITISNS